MVDACELQQSRGRLRMPTPLRREGNGRICGGGHQTLADDDEPRERGNGVAEAWRRRGFLAEARRRQKSFAKTALNGSENAVAGIVGGPLTAPGHPYTAGDQFAQPKARGGRNSGLHHPPTAQRTEPTAGDEA